MVDIKLNTREFDRVLAEYVKVNRREYTVIVNTKLKAIAFNALNYTEKADPSKIEAKLGALQTASQIASTKTGKRFKKARKVFGKARTFAEKIVLSKLGKGEKLSESELKSRGKKLISARKRGVAFIKSGWLPAIGILSKLVRGGGKRRDRSAKVIGKPKGTAKPVKDGAFINTSGTITNTAILPKSKSSFRAGRPMRVAVVGLQKGFDEETRSMIEYMQKKLQKINDRFKGR